MINLNSNFIYHRNIGIINDMDCFHMFETNNIYDIVPDNEFYAEIFINHNQRNCNNIKIFINNIENKLHMNNYETVKLIISINVFLKNKKLNI